MFCVLCNLFHVSISALQWLCNADKRTHSPPKRLYTFFSTLYSSLVRPDTYGTFVYKLVHISLLFYFSVKRGPCSLSALSRELRAGKNMFKTTRLFYRGWFKVTYSLDFFFHLFLKLELITTQAMRAGFSGGMVVDYPNSSKAKKSVLYSGISCVNGLWNYLQG